MPDNKKDNKKEYFSGSEEAKRWKDIPYEVLASSIFFWFSKYVNDIDKKARGAVVAESRRQADHALLRAYLRCKTSSEHNSKSLKKCSEKMQRQISSIRFEEKNGILAWS
jgi:GTP cyclohydrolase II